MDPKRLMTFRTLLKERTEVLRHSVAEAQQEERIAQEVYGFDEGDRAARSNEKELLSSRNARVRRLLEAIGFALGRIEDGTFGECLRCGQEINTKRLEALPWTRYCITCQALLEEQH